MGKTKQVTRDEWNDYAMQTEPVLGRCELETCPYKDAVLWHKLDCIDCEHWVEDEEERRDTDDIKRSI